MTEGLAFRSVSFAYQADMVVEDIGFSVNPGEIVCLLGPSGCGKTTCLRIAAGLETLRSGEVHVGGRLVSGSGVHVPPEQRRVGLVLQDFALFPHLDILDNVAFGIRGKARGAREAEARALLEQVGLGDYGPVWPHQISGGQQQRVALARALAPRPDVMLMDEPFSGLDVTLRSEVRATATDMLKARGVPTLVVTHDPQEALEIADRIALMKDGRLIQFDTPEQIYLHPRSAWVMRFFGHPNRLQSCIHDGEARTPFGALAAPDFAEGEEVEIFFRGAALSLADAEKGLKVRVESARLLGPIREVIVKELAGERSFRLDLPRRDIVRAGDILGLEARLEEFHIFSTQHPMVEEASRV